MIGWLPVVLSAFALLARWRFGKLRISLALWAAALAANIIVAGAWFNTVVLGLLVALSATEVARREGWLRRVKPAPSTGQRIRLEIMPRGVPVLHLEAGDVQVAEQAVAEIQRMLECADIVEREIRRLEDEARRLAAVDRRATGEVEYERMQREASRERARADRLRRELDQQCVPDDEPRSGDGRPPTP